jgi:monoterpene epsilon-lactone hydrolase
MRLTTLFLQMTFRPVSEPRRKYFGRRYPSPAPITDRLRDLCQIQEDRVSDKLVYTLKPKSGGSSWHIIYTHGGAYVNALIKPHWSIIEALIKATGATATIPTYPLAPKHQYMEAYHELEQVYRRASQEVTPERIVLCGDSSGGGLALGQALYYRAQGLPLPGHLILFSPWLDVTMSNPEAKGLEPKVINMSHIDVLRDIGGWWAGSADPKTPVISPIFGDLHNLPPIQVYIGTRDVLLPDAKKLRDLVLAAGGQIQLYETNGGFHVFMGATFTPEAKRVFWQVAENLGSAVSI